jgi:hypothetical protein
MLTKQFNLQEMLDLGTVQVYRNSTIKDDAGKVTHKGDGLYYTESNGKGDLIDDAKKAVHGSPVSCGGGVYMLLTPKGKVKDDDADKAHKLGRAIAAQLSSTNSLSKNRIGGKQGLVKTVQGVVNALNNSNLTEEAYLNIMHIAEQQAELIKAKCRAEMARGEKTTAEAESTDVEIF